MNKCFAVVAVVVSAGVVGLAGPLGLCDYKSPLTELTSLWLSGYYRYLDSPATPGAEVNAGRVAINFSRLYDSPNLGYTFSGLGEAGFTGLALSAVTTQASGTLRLYFQEGAAHFGFLGFEAGLATGQPQLGLRVSGGIGTGRFTDVTPLAKAFRIQSMLLGRKAIPAALPDGTLLAIAKEIGRRLEYAEVKDLVAAVVRLIETAAKVKLDARTVLMVEDEILAVGRDRYCGWALQAGIGYEVMDPYRGPQDLVVTASADAAYAPEVDSQLLLRAALAGPFDIVNQHVLTVTLSYERILGPASLFQGNAVAQRVKAAGEDAALSVSGTVQVSFSIGMANIGISLSLSKAADQTDWTKDLTLSLAMKLL